MTPPLGTHDLGASRALLQENKSNAAAPSVGSLTIENPRDGFLNKRELAARLKMTVRTVENWQRRGVLPYLKVGKVVLFDWPDVVEHLKANYRVCRRTVTK